MEEPSHLMENYITERQEVDPAYRHKVKENETEESLSHYNILSTTGNGTFTGRMKDEDFNSCVPIDSYESKTGALRQDIKRRPDIRIPQCQDREANFYQCKHLQDDSCIESAHNQRYQNLSSQCPSYNLPKHFTNKDVFKIDEQRQIEDYKNNHTPYQEPNATQEVHTYFRDDSKIPYREAEELIVPNASFSKQNYQRVKDGMSREEQLYEVPFQNRVTSVDEPSHDHDDLKIRNEILERNKTFPSIIQVRENDREFTSSCSIDEGYASTEMIHKKLNTNIKDAFPNSTLTKHQQLSKEVQVKESTCRQNILRSKAVLDEVDAFNESHNVKTVHVGEEHSIPFTSSHSTQRGYMMQTECGHFKAGLQDRLPFSKSPIGTAFRNELRQDAEMQARNKTGHSAKSSNIVYMPPRRISPSPLILRTNFAEQERQASDSKAESIGFALQDPPRKIKRQLSNEFVCRSTFVPAEEETENSLTPIQEPGTPKRLKSSTYQDLQQNPNVTQSSHYQNLQQNPNPHYKHHQLTSNVPSSPHYQNIQQTSNVPSSPHCQNIQQTSNVPLSPPIRTSSVIQTPKLKNKEENVFVFPDTASKPNSHEYRFHVSTTDSNQRLMKSDEENVYNRTTSTMSQFQAPYRPPPVTPQQGYPLLPRFSNDHGRGLYFGQQVSPGKKGPLRSQSNIEDKSPSKLSIAELDRIRYLRSVSLPASEHDQRFIHRSIERQESGYNYRDDNGARRELFRENSQMTNVIRGTYNCDYLQSVNELGVPAQRRISNINGPSMWDSQYHDQYIQHSPHPHTCNCCSTFSRHRPQTGDLNTRCQGDIDMTIQCSGIGRECQDISQRLQFLNHTQHGDIYCECKRVEDDVLQLALDAYRKIPKACYTLTEQRQRDQELKETNEMVLEAIKVALRMKQLCSNGRSVSRVYNGSVVIRLNCPTLNSLENLWLKYKSGELQTLINNIFITPSILLKNNAKFINLSVTVLENEYRACQAELASSFSKSTIISPSKNASPFKRSPDKRAAKSAEDLLRIPDSPKSTMNKARCSSTPILLCHSPLGSPMDNYSPNTSQRRERKFSFGDQSRRAFQDLNSPRSPNLFNLEEIRQIVESPLFDQDEDDQENISISFQSRGSNSRHGSPYSPLVSPKSPNCSPLSPRYSPR